MNVEFRLNNQKQEPIVFEVDIDENSPIKDLIKILHKLANVKEYKIYKLNGKDYKISCSYFYKVMNEFYDYEYVEDFEQKICDFPKKGENNELSLYFDINFYVGN